MKCLAILNFFPQSVEMGSESAVEKGGVSAHVLDLLSIVSD